MKYAHICILQYLINKLFPGRGYRSRWGGGAHVRWWVDIAGPSTRQRSEDHAQRGDAYLPRTANAKGEDQREHWENQSQ